MRDSLASSLPHIEESPIPPDRRAHRRTHVIPVSIKCLRDPEAVRLWAASVLIDIGEPAVPALIETMRDENEAVCTIATVVLSHIGQPAAPGLIAALRDEVELVRIHAALALKRIDTLEATKAVGEYEKQKD